MCEHIGKAKKKPQEQSPLSYSCRATIVQYATDDQFNKESHAWANK